VASKEQHPDRGVTPSESQGEARTWAIQVCSCGETSAHCRHQPGHLDTSKHIHTRRVAEVTETQPLHDLADELEGRAEMSAKNAQSYPDSYEYWSGREGSYHEAAQLLRERLGGRDDLHP
jgi:hypothetical protein